MKVKQLVEMLKSYDPDHDIVISGHTVLGFGHDFTVEGLRQYDQTPYVLLVPGDEYQEE